jgi:hypothetical protein
MDRHGHFEQGEGLARDRRFGVHGELIRARYTRS